MKRLALLALAVASCGGPFAELPRADQARWERCANTIMRSQCGPDQDMVYQSVCGRRLADEYATTNEYSRVSWLVGHGCSEGVAAYSSGGSR